MTVSAVSRARPRPGEAWVAWEASLRSRCGGVLYTKTGLRGADLEDAVSETMCRTFGRHVDAPFPSEDDAFRFGATVALNAAANAARHRQRHPTVAYHELLDTALGTDVSPSELVEESVRLAAVLDAVAALAPLPCAVITAKYVEGLSTRDAARRLGMTENYFGVALYRAMKALHQHLRKGGLLSVAVLAPVSRSWFGRMLRGARSSRASALSSLGMTAVLILGSPAIVVHPEERFTEATDRAEGLDVQRPSEGLREPRRGSAWAAKRGRRPTPPRVRPRRPEARSRLPQVEASVCVQKVCGGVGPSLPPAGPGDTPTSSYPGSRAKTTVTCTHATCRVLSARWCRPHRQRAV